MVCTKSDADGKRDVVGDDPEKTCGAADEGSGTLQPPPDLGSVLPKFWAGKSEWLSR